MKWQDMTNNKDVIEISKLVVEFRVFIVQMPGHVNVRVYQYPDGRFEGVSNFSIKPPGETKAHKSLNYVDSIDEAVLDSINGLLAHYPKDKEEQKKTQWIKDEDF